MQASDRVLAGRYAAALFQAADKKGEDQRVASDLGVARDLLLGATAALRHPRVSVADKKKLLHAQLDGKVGATALRFLELLIEKKRYELFAMVAAVYARLRRRQARRRQGRTCAPPRRCRPRRRRRWPRASRFSPEKTSNSRSKRTRN